VTSTVSVKLSVRARKVTVTGPRGSLTRSFRHLPVDMQMVANNKLKVEKWFGNRGELAAVNTVCSHVENMQKGVTQVVFKRMMVYYHNI
jgi:large subunit ribosomal protein L9e